ncbi:MAG TPA: Gfo/Idh/MocA family oxidoreductase [Armatimonadaceae bacterium]|nr:Gfo/Idh/MocA family oxidoreductase [Armatimonadaceae bacterium]
MTLLRVALVGCGIISEAHVRAYEKHADRARITVCCDIDPAKAEERARQVGEGTRPTTDFASVLADPDVDAVEICTPHHLHPDAVIAAARAGKHVLCQKPLANTLPECDAMIAAARDAGVTLFYGETNRTRPAAVAARKAVDEGRIGRVVAVQGTYTHWQGGRYLSTAWRYDPKVAGGGQLLDGGIHYVNVMRHVGGPVEAVSCYTTRFREELGGEDTAAVILRYAGGHLGTLVSSHAAGIWYPDASFAAIGTEGTLTMGGPYGGLCLHRHDLPERREVLLDGRGDDFAEMIGRYLDVVLGGAPNPAPAEVGRDDLALVLAAYESARLGREVSLKEIEP